MINLKNIKPYGYIGKNIVENKFLPVIFESNFVKLYINDIIISHIKIQKIKYKIQNNDNKLHHTYIATDSKNQHIIDEIINKIMSKINKKGE